MCAQLIFALSMYSLVPVGRAEFAHADRIGLLHGAPVFVGKAHADLVDKPAGERDARLEGAARAGQQHGANGGPLVRVPADFLRDLFEGPSSRHDTILPSVRPREKVHEVG